MLDFYGEYRRCGLYGKYIHYVGLGDGRQVWILTSMYLLHICDYFV